MLYNNINISRLIVHAQQVEESKISRKNRESKKERSYEGGFSKGRVDIQEKPRFKKRFSNIVPSKLTKDRDDNVSNPNSQKAGGTSSPTKKPTSRKCGKKHYKDC